ncbi:MAG TPA: heme-binding protein [Bryobacteraceae bacterium]|nr:heme-binding protein [Bryobacteraceae bacterium]
MKKTKNLTRAAALIVAVICPAFAQYRFDADDPPQNGCANLPSFAQLKAALSAATATEMSGLNNQMWGTIVDRDGIVCAVAFTGVNRGAQWPGSRAISAQKANTANAFSLDASSNSNGSGQPAGLALSTANLYSAVQPGGSLFGLQFSNPVDTRVAYQGPSTNYGTANDPMGGQKIGGVNVFGGGLALYGPGHVIVGGIGVSGDTSCADHNIAWRTRHALNLDHMAKTATLPAVGGVSGDPTRPDNIVFDITANPNGGTGISAGGFGHPTCLNTSGSSTLPVVQQ